MLLSQAKLLRFLEEGEFERLGSTETLKSDVRVIAATNKRLEKEITERRFRDDLYYQLADAVDLLKNQHWKGNCRELRNLIERAVVLVRATEINSLDLMKIRETTESEISFDEKPLREARDDFERGYILRLIGKYNGNLTKVAEVLEIDRSHLYRKLKELGIERKA